MYLHPPWYSSSKADFKPGYLEEYYPVFTALFESRLATSDNALQYGVPHDKLSSSGSVFFPPVDLVTCLLSLLNRRQDYYFFNSSKFHSKVPRSTLTGPDGTYVANATNG